jgi:hypothetical protein
MRLIIIATQIPLLVSLEVALRMLLRARTIIPFVPLVLPPPILPSVSSVNENIVSRHAKSRSRRQANKRLRSMITESSCDEAMEVSFVSPLILTGSLFASSPIQTTISAPSAALPIMEPALANVSESDCTALSILLSAHLCSLSLHQLLEHLSFSPDFIINDRLPYFDNLHLESSLHDSDPDYSKIRTPYSADAFHAYLSKAQILDRYPELCFKLTHGFPLGNIVDLDKSFTPGNLASSKPYDHVIQEYIADELKLGRFSGPFTQKELEAKIGPFRSSPIQVDVKPGEAGGPNKYRCCRNLSYRGNLGFSVNDDINSEEYPTRWGTASECAKIDSPLSHQFLKKDIQSLYGSLSHIAFVYSRGRGYLNNIIWWLTTFVSDFAPRFPPPSVISDLKWWSIQLSKSSIIRSLAPRPLTSDFNIWVDASTDWGIGLLINDSWDAWRTLSGWKAPGRDIGWLEAVAVELIVSLLNEMHLSHLDVLIRSDNEGVIGSFRKGWSRNQETNSCIRRAEAIFEQRDLSISLLYVESSVNLADPISRGILPPSNRRVTIPYSISPSISKYFYHA